MDDDRLPVALDRLTATETSRGDRVAALRDLAVGLGRRVASPGGVAEALAGLAPSLSVRDLAELREAYDGRSGRDLADALVATAAKVSGAIGAAGGVIATASEAAPIALLSAPVQLGVETLAEIAVELKLVAELHAALGRPLPEDRVQRASLVLRSWTSGRGVGLADLAAGGGLRGMLTRAARSRLREQVLKRFARSTVAFIPLLAGAAAGAAVNARATRKLGEGLIEDLLRPRQAG